MPPKNKKLQNIDVFFAYPTVYVHLNRNKNYKNHNMNINNPFYKTLATICSKWQTSPFKEDCNIYAPYYRQVGIEALQMTDAEFVKHAYIAYLDLKDAFIYFLEHLNNGRPFILVGHSQGSAILQELMRREFMHKKYSNNMIAAYLIGFSILREDFIFYPHLKFAKHSDDLGVIISYNTIANGLKPLRVIRKGAMCINPLSWSLKEDYADKSLNKRTIFFDFWGIFKLEHINFTGAYINKECGTLVIDDDAMKKIQNYTRKGMKKFFLSSASLHMLDIALFHDNIKENAQLRIKKFLEKKSL